MRYNLTVRFDAPEDREELLKILGKLIGDSFRYSYHKSIAPPNKIEIDFENLSDAGLAHYKALFRQFNITGGTFTVVDKQ